MYVKLAVSVAAHLDSEIMIMDEVLAVGDIVFQKKCLDKMRDAAKKEGRTVLYVSHNMNTIRQLCDRCVVLDKGKVVFEGGVEDAIGIYLGTVGTLQSRYQYNKEHHSNKKSCDTFRLNEMRLIDRAEAQFDSGEQFMIEIQCYAKKHWENIKLRFELQFQDGSIVGTMLSKGTASVHANTHSSIFCKFDTAHLTPGRYKADIIAYVDNEFGAEQFLDGVYPGFVFEISDTLNENNQLNWLHQYWGHIHLHDADIYTTKS